MRTWVDLVKQGVRFEPQFGRQAFNIERKFKFWGEAGTLPRCAALKPIPGLYAAGEMVGGLFYFNYPGASGLASGTVSGRIAGRSAGHRVKEKGAA